MADPIRVSRHGLTCCPGCKSHIKLEDELAQVSCPFCGSSLLAAPGGAPKVSFGRKGRSLLAASLLGAAMIFTACPGAEPPTEKSGEQATEKTQGDGGNTDVGAAPAYGIAPAPDGTDQPLYGNVP